MKKNKNTNLGFIAPINVSNAVADRVARSEILSVSRLFIRRQSQHVYSTLRNTSIYIQPYCKLQHSRPNKTASQHAMQILTGRVNPNLPYPRGSVDPVQYLWLTNGTSCRPSTAGCTKLQTRVT